MYFGKYIYLMRGRWDMNISVLNNGYKIDIVSSSNNYFGEEVYTKYSILKYEGMLFLLFKGRYMNGEEIFNLNIINDIYTEIIEEDIKINIPNEIVIGNSISGTYTNGFRFNIENIISIKEDVMKEEEIAYCNKRRNLISER